MVGPGRHLRASRSLAFVISLEFMRPVVEAVLFVKWVVWAVIPHYQGLSHVLSCRWFGIFVFS